MGDYTRVSQNQGRLSGGPYKDYSILGVHIEVPLFWEATV